MGVSPVLTQGQVARVRQVPTPPLPLAQLGAAPPQLSATLGLRMSAPGSGQRQQPRVITNKQISLLTFVSLHFSQRTDDPGGWTRSADVRVPRLFPWFSQWHWQEGFAQQYASWIQVFTTLLLIMCDNMSLYVSHDLVVAGSSPSVTSVASSILPKVVMSVDDFYYGTFNGDLSVRKTQTLAIKTSAFTCVTCSYLAENNLR